MTKCNIIGKNEEIKATTTVEFSQSFMDMPKLTCRVLSAVPIAFEIDDYITFLGTKYYLDTLPNSKQNKGIGSSGDSLTYNLIFLGVERELDRYLMSDIVLSDNNVHYTSLTIFDAFCTPLTLIDRITANLNVINADYGFSNDNRWSIILPSDIAEIEADGKNLSFNNETLWNVLKRINDDFGLKFVTSGRKIYIYKTNYPFTSSETIFEYGKGKGLTEVSETFSESKIITRLKVYGGTTNLPLDYSNRLASDELRYTPNLMLPDYFESGGVIDYLEDKNAVAKFGIRYDSVTLDSIFPTIEKITFGDIDGSDSTTRIDEVYAVVNDAHVGNNSIFKIWVLFPFDLNEYSEVNQSRYFVQGTKVSFKDGLLGGYSFELLSVELVSEPNGYELTLGKIQNPDAGENNIAYLPDDVVKAQVGDHFILEGCFLPEVLVQAAQNRLRKEGLALLAEKSIAKPTFPISFDNIYLANNSKDADKLKCGATIRFTYPSSHGDFVIEDTIQQLSIKNGSGGLLQYSISLSNQPSLSKLGAIEKNYTRNLNLTTALKIESNRKYVQFGQEVASKASTEDFNKLKQLFDSMFELDSNNNAIKAKLSLYSVGAISAMGIGSGGSNSGGGVSYDRLDSWADYTSDKAGYVLSALLGSDLNTRLSSVEGDYATKDYVTTKLVDYAPLASVQGFENRIAGLEGAVPQLNERVTTVEGKVSSLNEIVSTGENNLLDRVNTIETDYVTSGNLESAINDIDLSIYLKTEDAEDTYATKDYVNNKLTNYATTDSVTAIQNTLTGQIGAVGVRVDSNDEQIAILNETTSGHTTSIGTLTQRVDSVEQLAATKLDSSYFTLANIKSTLGISDWALAATKPSYAWSEITSRPTALSQFTDDVVAGKYLPLSKFQVAEVANPSTVYLQSGIYRQSDGSHLAVGTSGWSQFITLFAGGDNWAQMYFSYDGRLHYRIATFGDGDPANIPWTAIITEKNIGNYNAGSATKLQTPRKLWGQSFDGTADVNGLMYTGNEFHIEHPTTGRQLGISPYWTILGYNNPMIGNPTYIDGRNVYIRYGNDEYTSVFASNGNVGIGNTSPTERLDVSGNIKASGNINATSITINGVTITASNGSITVNGNVLATGAITAKAVG